MVHSEGNLHVCYAQFSVPWSAFTILGHPKLVRHVQCTQYRILNPRGQLRNGPSTANIVSLTPVYTIVAFFFCGKDNRSLVVVVAPSCM